MDHTHYLHMTNWNISNWMTFYVCFFGYLLSFKCLRLFRNGSELSKLFIIYRFLSGVNRFLGYGRIRLLIYWICFWSIPQGYFCLNSCWLNLLFRSFISSPSLKTFYRASNILAFSRLYFLFLSFYYPSLANIYFCKQRDSPP